MCSYTWMYCTVSHTGGDVRQTGFLSQSWLTACSPQATPDSLACFNSVPGPWCQGHTNMQCGSVVGGCKCVYLTSSQHQEVTCDSPGFTHHPFSSSSSSSIFHYMLIAFLCSETWHSNCAWNQLSQPANQYLQRYHFHGVTRHSLSKFCLSNCSRYADRACGDASRQHGLLTQI